VRWRGARRAVNEDRSVTHTSNEQAERAVDALMLEQFSNADVSVLLPDNHGSKDFAHEKHTKAPEGTTTGAAGGTIGGTPGLLAGIGLWRSLALGRLSPPDRLWEYWQVLVWAEPSAAWSGHLWVWIFRNTKPSGTKAASRTAASFCRSIATSDEITRAKDVLKRTGAEDISSAGEKPSAPHRLQGSPTEFNRADRRRRPQSRLYGTKLPPRSSPAWREFVSESLTRDTSA
jgi:hypothetical protein